MDEREIAELLDKDMLDKEDRKILCHSLVTTEPQMEKLILKYFTQKDYQEIQRKRIGKGTIGGKACGLLLANKLIEIYMPECEECLEESQAYFIGTGVFDEYINIGKNVFEGYDVALRQVLDSYGETPYIVRSSSRLEDGFNSSFTGKYASVFCCNQGSKEEKFEELKKAVCQVYESVFWESAVQYRKNRNCPDEEEKMGILIQEVVGEKIEDYYFPAVAGMGCSYNPYRWVEEMDITAGMVRMVLGLGTRAVQRTPGDYPRLVSLNRPKANIRTTMADRHKYSQRYVDVIDLKEKRFISKKLEDILNILPDAYKKLTLNRDTDAEAFLREQRDYRNVYFADCQGVVENDKLIYILQRMEKILEKEYGQPVDIEFAVTRKSEEWRLNILQCRPVKNVISESIHIKDIPKENVLFDVRRTSMRCSKEINLDYIVWVNPQSYYEYTYRKKADVADTIRKINQYFKGKDKKLLLLVPGRIGTSSPELGVPVTSSDIYQFCAICEVAYGKAGYNPELSYGSHMFQDLIEADIYYGAICENSKTIIYQPEILQQRPEVLGEILDEKEEIKNIVKLYEVNSNNARLYLDIKQGRALCVV